MLWANCRGPTPTATACSTTTTTAPASRIRTSKMRTAMELATHSYAFAGFFAPVDNLPTVNVAKAGSAIPIKFTLGGDQGLDILAAGYPRSVQVPCDSTAPADAIEETATAGHSGLTYDSVTDR